jgi:RHS repeat-associated protein
MTYDGGNPGPGNITARSDIVGGSTWTYDPVRKHAVTQTGTGGYAYTYDANGNATSRNGYAIAWSSYNYPISISALNKNVTLYYGPNRQYYKQVYEAGSAIETTIYVGGLLEKVTDGSLVDWRHYIRVGSELVAIMSRQSTGTNVTHYMLSDHESSIAAITDGAGAATVSESFGAFGTRRNPSTWSGMPTCPDLCTIASISREGYTGQDAMGGVSMGINHMKGRIQDAITGRFLSADPYVPDPTNTQSYNRYSYVNNNPLSLVDPSGFDDQDPCDEHGCKKPIDPPPASYANQLDGIQVYGNRPTDDLGSCGVCVYFTPQPQPDNPNGSGSGDQLPEITVTAKKPNRQTTTYTTPFFQRQPCQSFGGFFADANAAIGFGGGAASTATGLAAAARNLIGAAKSYGGVDGGFAAAAAGSTAEGVAVLTVDAATAFGAGYEIGAGISAAINYATCTNSAGG